MKAAKAAESISGLEAQEQMRNRYIGAVLSCGKILHERQMAIADAEHDRRMKVLAAQLKAAEAQEMNWLNGASRARTLDAASMQTATQAAVLADSDQQTMAAKQHQSTAADQMK